MDWVFCVLSFLHCCWLFVPSTGCGSIVLRNDAKDCTYRYQRGPSRGWSTPEHPLRLIHAPRFLLDPARCTSLLLFFEQVASAVNVHVISVLTKLLNKTVAQPAKSALELSDPEVFQICQNEKERQRIGVQLIASEVRLLIWVKRTLRDGILRRRWLRASTTSS